MKDPRLYLAHIRECVDRILSYTDGLGRDWSQQPMILDAVCRNLEIIGEAANKLGEPYRSAHPEIPWRRIRDLPLLRRQIIASLNDDVSPVD